MMKLQSGRIRECPGAKIESLHPNLRATQAPLELWGKSFRVLHAVGWRAETKRQR